ncbi:hypothetical protein T484DRAFT_1817131 [Baffinella frigidus]|nr:hypothetical protein T484DRAFT_1817131 [Cryptophyta sp. CCMP2293]
MNGPGDLVEKYTCQVCVLAFRIQWTQDSYEALTTARFDKSAMIHTQKRNITSVDILTRFLQDHIQLVNL